MKAPPFPQRRILVVDDEPFVCDAVKMMLAFDGHSVETASSAKDALALFEKSKFDLVITDFAMPAMKGDELALANQSPQPTPARGHDHRLRRNAPILGQSFARRGLHYQQNLFSWKICVKLFPELLRLYPRREAWAITGSFLSPAHRTLTGHI
jgi:CheY-like chemotaxis protein